MGTFFQFIQLLAPSPADQHLGAAGADNKVEDRGHLVIGLAVQARDGGEAPPRRRPTQAAAANTGAGAPR